VPHSSRGLGRRPLTAVTPVRIRYAVLREAPASTTCRGFAVHGYPPHIDDDLQLRAKVTALMELSGLTESELAWLNSMTPGVMWRLIDRPSGMTGILVRRIAVLFDVEYERFGDPTAQLVAAAGDAFATSPAGRLNRGEIAKHDVRRKLCGDVM
jgi:hypothetical protein